MLIGDYFDEIGRLIHEHETAGFLLSRDAHLCGPIRAARSRIRAVSGDHVERLALAYHYQDAAGTLRFRYDNARHRPPAVSTVHKHVGQDLVPVEDVTLADVLREIVGRHLVDT